MDNIFNDESTNLRLEAMENVRKTIAEEEVPINHSHKSERAEADLDLAEEIKKDGFTDLEREMEKALEMYQMYPCLRYKIQSYINLIKKNIIGQDAAIKTMMFVAYFNQYLNFLEEYLEVSCGNRKSVLFVAPTGNGKTELMRTLKNVFGVPMYMANISSVTSSGYVGESVEHMLVRLVEIADGDVSSAERGILFIDEIDKKAECNEMTGRDIAGKSVQQELLKILDKSEVNISVKVPESQDKYVNKTVTFETKNLTIFLAGAFVGLDKIREKRLGNHKIGFDPEEKQLESKKYNQKDLVDFGLIPELVGRIDIIQEFNKLTADDIVECIYNSGISSMQEHVRILETLSIKKVVIDGALWENVAEIAVNSDFGMRTVNSIITAIFNPILFEALQHLNSGECTIHEDGSYELVYGNESYKGSAIDLSQF